jgi:hypothetical protein
MMNKNALPAGKIWVRPEVTRLGKIRDVAGSPGGLTTNGKNTART